jgi:hypothetical protein
MTNWDKLNSQASTGGGMSKWDKLREYGTDFANYDISDSAFTQGWIACAEAMLSKMAELEEQDDGSEDLEARITFLEGALRSVEQRFRVENEALRKDVADLEEITETCCKPAQEEISRLWTALTDIVKHLESTVDEFTLRHSSVYAIAKRALEGE